MSGSIYMVATGALAYEKRLQILANNLSNLNTAGFKKDKGYFQVFDPAVAGGDNKTSLLNSSDSQAPLFWMQFSSLTDYSSGELKNTGNAFDLALIGKGFFCVQTSQGIQYTRRGDFTISPEGLLVTQQGWPVLGNNGEINVESKTSTSENSNIEVGEDGNVWVDGKQVDRLRIVDFQNLHFLEKVGNTFFRPRDPLAKETKAEDFKISQGFVELSNVNPVRMMTEMIEVLRGYESYQKMMRFIDDINAKVINEVGKTA